MSEEPVFPTIQGPPQVADNLKSTQVQKNDWTTTYSSFIRPCEEKVVSEHQDSHRFQATHWSAGNERTDYQSETKSNFIKYSAQPQVQGRTRDQLMKSSFTFNDGYKMPTRESLAHEKFPGQAAERVKGRSKTELQQSHIAISGSGGDTWKTTSQASFGWPSNTKMTVPSIMDSNLRDGTGAREAISSEIGRPTGLTEAQAQFRAPSQGSFHHSSTADMDQKCRKTYLRVGGDEVTYETTNSHDFKKPEYVPVDVQKRRQQKAQLVRSSFDVGDSKVHEGKSSYNETFVPLRDETSEQAREMRQRNAQQSLISHHNYKNCNQTFKTTSQDSYIPFQTSGKREAAHMNLEQTHVKVGEDNIHDMTTLYNETFKDRSKSSIQSGNRRNESKKMKEFFTQHHTNVTTIVGLEENKTINQLSYQPHPEVRPRSPAKFDNTSRAISMSDPSLIVTKSTVQTDFVPLHARPERVCTNNFQNSHINLGGNDEMQWSTTQSEYFQYKTFRKA